MPGRKFNETAYRYGMNAGSEKDDEIYGSGNASTAEYWEYDTRLGRRWNIDQIIKSWESSYAVFNNNPIFYSDPSGLNGEPPAKNEKGHEYDCGDGTKEIFNGKGYVPLMNEVVTSASRGGSKAWNKFMSNLDVNAAQRKFADKLLYKELHSWYYKGRYGTDDYGMAYII
jgi:hypothetical protein